MLQASDNSLKALPAQNLLKSRRLNELLRTHFQSENALYVFMFLRVIAIVSCRQG
jgi:hypothetical protein